MVTGRRVAMMAMVALAAAVPVRAQIPERFTNLKVLPRDIPRPELIRTMRTWAGSLGVRCTHCHVGPDNLQGMDFATDSKPTKVAAREMIRMVQTINGSVLPSLPPREGTREAVSCYTCHRREARPPLPMHEELLRTTQGKGAAAAAERYRELRRSGETAGKYDFTPDPIAFAASTLAEQGRPDDALVLAQLGVEQHPQAADAHAVLGLVRLRRGERAAAVEAFRAALQRDPQHAIALRQLKELETPPPAPSPSPGR